MIHLAVRMPDARREPIGALLPLLALVTTLAATWLALWLGPLPIFAAAAGAVVLVVAWNRPAVLLYAYCAAIPFNFALPAGPAGTVARAAGIVFFVGYLLRRPGAFRPASVHVLGWLFVGWALASCLWATNANTAVQSWLSLAQLFAITILVAGIVATDPSTARTALWSYAIAAAATAVLGSVSYLQSPTLFLARAAAFADQDPALWASALLPAALFLAFEVASRGVPSWLRVVALAGLAACIVGLALSGTRSAWVAGLVGLTAWIGLRRDPRQLLPLAGAACAVALLASAVPGVGDFLADRAGTSLSSGGGRVEIWQVGIGILGANPVTGVGWAGFPNAFGPYAIALWGASSQGVLFAGRAAHNVLLGVSVETGVVGALLLSGFCAAALLTPKRARLGMFVGVALLALFAQAMFLDVLLQKQVWLLLGVAFGLALASEREHAAKDVTEDPTQDPAVEPAAESAVLEPAPPEPAA